jgi:hypothetical protein
MFTFTLSTMISATYFHVLGVGVTYKTGFGFYDQIYWTLYNFLQVKCFVTVTTQHFSILPFTSIAYTEFIDLDCYMFRPIKEPSSGSINEKMKQLDTII